jgi:hypothetical protein
MRALCLFGALAIGSLVALGAGCSSDDNKGDGGTGGSAGSSGAGGSSGSGGTGGSAGSGSAKYSCERRSAGLCWTYDAGNIPSPAALIQSWESACTAGMGMTVTTCPTTGAVGKCTFTSNDGGYSISTTMIYYPPFTAAQGMQLCMTNNSGGTATWTPL